RNAKNSSATTTTNYQPPFISQAASELETLFETSVTATANSQGKGVIKISFESQEQLQRILNKVKK
ncbi:MAG: chromosome partitioning protein ParB, partial [Flavobacteriales bacterium]